MVKICEKIMKLSLPTPFPVGDVNVYLIKGEALTLIDAGVKTKAAWETFQAKLKEVRLSVEDIEQVILTHHHPDHIGILEWLPEHIPVYGHRYVRPWIEKDQAFFQFHDEFYKDLFINFGVEGDFDKMLAAMKSTLRFAGTRSLSNEIKEGDKIPGFEDWEVIETLGHAQSHLVFYREKDGVLLAGDHLLATISSNPLLEPPLTPFGERPQPQLQYNNSLRKILDHDIQIAYTGHGGEIKKVHDLIDHRLERQHERAWQVRDMIKETPLTTFELTKLLFPSVYEKELGFTLSETTGQLDYLLSLDAINEEVNDEGVSYFSAL